MALHYKNQAGVVEITLASFDTDNALNPGTLFELRRLLERAVNAPDARAIVLSARGTAFCRGLDLGTAFGAERRPEHSVLRAFADCLLLIARSPLPVLAKVEQLVSGGGVGLVAACDIVLCRDEVVFSLPEVVVGMIPALVTPVLLRRLSPGQVRYLTLSARGVGALEAQTMGLVDEVVTGEIDVAFQAHLRRLFCSSPRAVSVCKQYLDTLSVTDLVRQMDVALETLEAWLDEPGTCEGIQAFAEGLTPPWFQRYRESSHG